MQATVVPIWDSNNLKQSICNPEQIIEPLCFSKLTCLKKKKKSVTDVFEATFKKSFKSLSIREHRSLIPINQTIISL